MVTHINNTKYTLLQLTRTTFINLGLTPTQRSLFAIFFANILRIPG